MDYFIFSFALLTIYAGLAILLHVQFGMLGIPNFGVVGFWGLGMYSVGVMNVQYEIPFFLALVITMLVIALVAYIIGRLVLMLDGSAILCATLAFSAVVTLLVITEKWLTMGVVGLGTIKYPFEFGQSSELIYLILIVTIIVWLQYFVLALHRSSLGRLMVAIRDNEELASSLGKNTVRTKLQIFVLTSCGMGLLGGLSAPLNQFLTPNMLVPGVTFSIWIGLVMGGKEHALGGAIGVLLTFGLFDILIETYAPVAPEYAVMVPNIKLFIYGTLLVAVLMFRPDGMLGRASHGNNNRKSLRLVQIRVNNLSKTYLHNPVVSIENAVFGANPVEGLIGPNGAGKSTLMGLVTRRIPCTTGSIWFDVDEKKHHLNKLESFQVSRLGLVKTNQRIQNFDSLTIRDSLRLAATPNSSENLLSVFNSKQAERSIEAEIDTYLSTFAFSKPDGYALSGGEKKLLDILRCLMFKPKMLLMDEPTAGLPDDVTRKVMELVTRKAREDGLKVIIVEHDLDLIWSYCDYVHFLSEGEMSLQGTPDEVRKNSVVAEKYMGS